MDSDLWISRLAAAKRQYSLHHHLNSQSDRMGVEDLEAEEVRPDFPCPYCYEDHDITSLCSHLEDEHSFESGVAACPICSIKVTRDMLNHITLHHGHLFKLQRRRRLHRVAIPSSQALSLLGRDLREAHLQVLLGNGSYRSRNTNTSITATDSYLSSLVLSLSTSEAEEASKSPICNVEDTCLKKVASPPTWRSSIDLSLSHEELEKRRRQATVRANVVQELLLSTLFSD